MKLNIKDHWKTVETAVQTFNTVLLRHTDKLNEFEKALNNRIQDLQDLPKEEETTMENNLKGIKEATYQEVLSCKKHHHE
ncbi:unnamed protein product [Schistosoma mattheei]|uniref:Uncharacterized protein n=1 Tax=Schistosoma mattheei TaxID=31246 RepID=A0A183Q105_9TREM|nr:unnamed protein product [Schistosoma mattheei]